MPCAAFDIGSTNSRIVFLDASGYPLVLEHNARRLTPSRVAYRLSPSGETDVLIGQNALGYIVYLTNSIYDIRRLVNRMNCEDLPLGNGRLYDFMTTADKSREEKKKNEVEKKTGVKSPLLIMLEPPPGSKLGDSFWRHRLPEEVIKDLTTGLLPTLTQHCPVNELEKIAMVVPVQANKEYCERIYGSVPSILTKRPQLVEEPLAAAAAYLQCRLKLPEGRKESALVFCLGAGYFQAAKLTLGNHEKKGGLWMVLEESVQDEQLSGYAIDELIEREMHKRFEDQENKGKEEGAPKFSFLERVKPKARRRFRLECQKVKEVLSNTPHTLFQVDSLYMRSEEDEDAVDFECQLTSEEITEFYRNILETAVMKAVKLFKGRSPSFVIVAGGCVRLPLIATQLKEAFPEAIYCDALNHDEVSVIGAALVVGGMVHILENEPRKKQPKIEGEGYFHVLNDGETRHQRSSISSTPPTSLAATVDANSDRRSSKVNQTGSDYENSDSKTSSIPNSAITQVVPNYTILEHTNNKISQNSENNAELRNIQDNPKSEKSDPRRGLLRSDSYKGANSAKDGEGVGSLPATSSDANSVTDRNRATAGHGSEKITERNGQGTGGENSVAIRIEPDEVPSSSNSPNTSRHKSCFPCSVFAVIRWIQRAFCCCCGDDRTKSNHIRSNVPYGAIDNNSAMTTRL